MAGSVRAPRMRSQRSTGRVAVQRAAGRMELTTSGTADSHGARASRSLASRCGSPRATRPGCSFQRTCCGREILRRSATSIRRHSEGATCRALSCIGQQGVIHPPAGATNTDQERNSKAKEDCRPSTICLGRPEGQGRATAPHRSAAAVMVADSSFTPYGSRVAPPGPPAGRSPPEVQVARCIRCRWAGCRPAPFPARSLAVASVTDVRRHGAGPGPAGTTEAPPIASGGRLLRSTVLRAADCAAGRTVHDDGGSGNGTPASIRWSRSARDSYQVRVRRVICLAPLRPASIIQPRGAEVTCAEYPPACNACANRQRACVSAQFHLRQNR
jgi:hypothetical protein